MASADLATPFEDRPKPAADVAVVRAAMEAFAAKDIPLLEDLLGGCVFRNAVTGVAVGKSEYEGERSLDEYLADAARVWSELDLRPRTFHSPRPGEVLVLGSVRTVRGGVSSESATAWRFKLDGGKITLIELLPSAEGIPPPDSRLRPPPGANGRGGSSAG